MSNLAFGNASTTTASITYKCETDTFPSAADTAVLQMCFAIGEGRSPGSTVAQRSMNDGVDKLYFNVSKDPGAPSNDWGNTPGTYKRVAIEVPLSASGFLGLRRTGSATGNVTVYGRIPSRLGAAAGTYTNEFQAGDTTLMYRYNDTLFGSGDPVDCQSGGAPGVPDAFPFKATAAVLGSCSVVTASNMNFTPGGMPLSGTSTGNLASSSTIGLTCTNRTAWQVGLDEGLYPSAGVRRMCNTDGACLSYQLTQPDGATPWGDDLDVNTVVGISEGSRQSLTVHGRVNDQPLTQAGRYSDTVKVILTY
ncbi:Csu type fimbrial protein [Novilysobacter luteus]|nr:spore coat U domain-containing protein [Lysobacter luteus]